MAALAVLEREPRVIDDGIEAELIPKPHGECLAAGDGVDHPEHAAARAPRADSVDGRNTPDGNSASL